MPSYRHRSPGEGSVYQAADGRWRGAATWTNPDGTRGRRIVSARTQADARDKLDEVRRELRLGTVPATSRRLTVAEYLLAWLGRDRARVRPSTSHGRSVHVRVHLVPALGRIPLVRLTPHDVERMTSGMVAAGRSARTALHARATLRRALADAVRDGLVARNAAADSRPPYVAHRRIEYLDADQVRRLLAATRRDDFGPLYAVAASTGLRLGELLGLRWSDVDLDARTLRVARALVRDAAGGWSVAEPKSARSRRTLALPSVAVAALTEQRARQDVARAAAGPDWQDVDGTIFTDLLGRSLRPHVVSSAYRRARDRVGLPDVPFHGLRHSAATLALAEGVPLAVVSDMLGHSGIAITAAHYAAIVPALRRDAADAMDRALGDG